MKSDTCTQVMSLESASVVAEDNKFENGKKIWRCGLRKKRDYQISA